jgi:hypothetical protein
MRRRKHTAASPATTKSTDRDRDDQASQIALLLLQAELNQDPKRELSLFELSMLSHRAYWLLDQLTWCFEGVAKADKWHKEITSLNLPYIVPFNEAVKIITRQKRRLDRALERFKLFPFIYGWFDFGGALGKWPPGRPEWRKRLERWRENGITRNEVICLHAMWKDKDYQAYRIAHADWAKKRRPPWNEQRREQGRIQKRRRDTA